MGLELNLEVQMDRLRRITDLFVEGQELYLGMDDDNKPVVAWVNKLNSFEVEEARKDGVTARGLRLLELQKEDNPERMAMQARVDRWSDDELAQARVDQLADEIYLETINDLESDEDWREKIAMLRRMPQLLEDEGAPADDERRAQLEELNGEYLGALREALEKKNASKLREFKGESRRTLVEDFMEAWRNRLSLDTFMAERRATELYAVLRDCQAEEVADGQGGRRWNHAKCDHRVKLLSSRGDVKTLPEGVLQRVTDLLDGITVPQRESGNSDAPASSSASSEQPSTQEESTPSIPDVTPSAVPTT